MNAREMIVNISEWLSFQDETLSYGLHNAFDALRLYDYSLEHSELSEMADDWEPQDRIAALGYDPMNGKSFEVETTGARSIAFLSEKDRRLISKLRQSCKG